MSNKAVKTKTNTGWFPLIIIAIFALPFLALSCFRILYGKSLWKRALHYDAKGHYAKAEALLGRARAIMEKELGPEHPTVGTALEDHAALLRELGRETEAAELDTRAERIGPAAPGRERRWRSRGSTPS
jgi:tetratricopeptide (TPR) repeat protein